MSDNVVIPVDDRVTNLTIKLQSSSNRLPTIVLYQPDGMYMVLLIWSYIKLISLIFN